MASMISLIQTVAAGNALRVFLEPPASARRWRLLRKVSSAFLGHDDPDAFAAYEGDDRPVMDSAGLVNGTLYYYRPYYWNGTVWAAGNVVSATPAATYEGVGADVLSLLRERLDLGLQVEVQRGTLVHDNGHIEVLTAPPATETTVWPLVTVHLQEDAPGDRAIGEFIGGDGFDPDTGLWDETEGWLAKTQIAIMGWSLNPDERIELRQALRRIVIANLPVFEAASIVDVEFSQQDTEDFSSYDAPVYQVLCTFSCTSPVAIKSTVPAVTSVIQIIVE